MGGGEGGVDEGLEEEVEGGWKDWEKEGKGSGW